MTLENKAIKLLGILAILLSVPVSHSIFAATVTEVTIDSIVVTTTPDSIAVVCTDPTYDAGETIVGRQLLIDDDNLFASPEITVGGATDTIALVCDGTTTNDIDFSSASYTDFDTVNVELRVFSDFPSESFDTDTFIVGDDTNPIVTGSTTNIVSGGSTVKTLTDQYTESCTATDNDVSFVDNCAVQTGGIDTSVLGLQSVTYFATDPSGNVGTQTITTTVVIGNAPVITILGANPLTLVLHQNYTEFGATASDVEDGDLTGSIITDSSGVDVDTVGSYIVTYDVTDSSGNSDHKERTVNVILGNAPVITITGDVSIFLSFGFPAYSDQGATCTDVEDGSIAVVTTGVNLVNPSASGTYQITYTCTDSSGNVSTEFRSVTVGNAPTGDSCSGDCESPTLGLAKSGNRVVENGLSVSCGNNVYVANVVPFFTPMPKMNANVGQTCTVSEKIYENEGKDNIRHAELGIGAKEIGDKDAMARIEIDRSFDGVLSVNIIDPKFILTDPLTGARDVDISWKSTNCIESQTNAQDCAYVSYSFVVRSPIKQYVLVTDVWDSSRRNQVTFFNHGIYYTGETMNPLENHFVTDSTGHFVQITEDEYMGNTSHDASGNLYTLQKSFWIPVIDSPVKEKYTNAHGIDRESGYFESYAYGQEVIATHTFDSAKIQGDHPSPTSLDLSGVDFTRGHHTTNFVNELAKATAMAHSGMQ